MFKKRIRQRKPITYETKEETIGKVLEKVKRSSDFSSFYPVESNHCVRISYFQTLIDTNLLHQSVLPNLIEKIDSIKDLHDIKKLIPIEGIKISSDATEVGNRLHEGYAVIQLQDNLEDCALLRLGNSRFGNRETNETENEFSVIGPKTGFIEDLNTNLHLIRGGLVTTDLIFDEMEVGTRSKTKVVVAYLEGVTNPDYVQTARQRISDLDIDLLYDNTRLEQLISDHVNTPFPLYITTERVDRAIFALVQGEVAIISDKSCYVVTGPANLMDFFSSPEDFYLPWIVGTFFKLIRIIGMLFSVFSTPFYVAILTFHFEVVPKDLLGPIVYSRANVPFPPVVEVLFLELTIEFLREAGARLPTKIGQTLGIVGGIVIGQATVEAALTSNILLIIVALSALSSFTTPIYKMSNAIRILRYPFIVLAALYGGFGIYLGVILLIGHLMRLKSFGSPYMIPLFPYRKGGFSQSFTRLPFPYIHKRTSFLRPLTRKMYDPKTKQDPEEGLNTE
ncbi:spore germination protein [Neobacillus sp. MM2021_6]|uniref:spore germination protein n=1 Tax=Bacillaceae TaxID=186817 RepID=UPI001407CA9B|nr:MULTISPECIES: spore germination protein [Bacillaceae]MBO0958451.1 spore germination protein [Neobacillus sp. MM2021_6]NHC20732.1 spore germination protein [Bacillus sp. MM2020_4]